MTNEDMVRYRIETAEHDVGSMKRNFSNGDFVWALFIGHLVIEKLLKACCARTLGKDVPRTHNLVLLAETAELEVNEGQRKILARLMQFNARVRYPDWQQQFYRVADREYTVQYIEAIEELQRWLLHLLSQQSSR